MFCVGCLFICDIISLCVFICWMGFCKNQRPMLNLELKIGSVIHQNTCVAEFAWNGCGKSFTHNMTLVDFSCRCCWLPSISGDHGFALLLKTAVGGAAPVVTVQAHTRGTVSTAEAAPEGWVLWIVSTSFLWWWWWWWWWWCNDEEEEIIMIIIIMQICTWKST